MTKPVGGRGKKAPYETMQMRVPVPVKPLLEKIIERFRNGKSLPINMNTGLKDSSSIKLNTGLENEEQDSNQDDFYNDDSEPTDTEVIKTQAKIIQSLLDEKRCLEKELELSRNEVKSLKIQIEQVRSQPVKLDELVQGLRKILNKVSNKEKGYRDNGFSQGLKDFRNLVDEAEK